MSTLLDTWSLFTFTFIPSGLIASEERSLLFQNRNIGPQLGEAI